MSNATKAAEDILSFASRIRSFLDVAEFLKGLGSLEQAESELKIKVKSANEEALKAIGDAAGKKLIVAKLDEEIEYARKSAEEIVANAKSRAMSIVDEGGVEANKIVRGASDKKSLIENQIKDLDAKLYDVKNAIAAQESILRAVTSKIEEAKAKVASLLS